MSMIIMNVPFDLISGYEGFMTVGLISSFPIFMGLRFVFIRPSSSISI